MLRGIWPSKDKAKKTSYGTPSQSGNRARRAFLRRPSEEPDGPHAVADRCGEPDVRKELRDAGGPDNDWPLIDQPEEVKDADQQEDAAREREVDPEKNQVELHVRSFPGPDSCCLGAALSRTARAA